MAYPALVVLVALAGVVARGSGAGGALGVVPSGAALVAPAPPPAPVASTGPQFPGPRHQPLPATFVPRSSHFAYFSLDLCNMVDEERSASYKCCVGISYYSQALQATGKPPMCFGATQQKEGPINVSLDEVPSSASLFKHYCIGYSSYPKGDLTKHSKDGAVLQMPYCEGIELLLTEEEDEATNKDNRLIRGCMGSENAPASTSMPASAPRSSAPRPSTSAEGTAPAAGSSTDGSTDNRQPSFVPGSTGIGSSYTIRETGDASGTGRADGADGDQPDDATSKNNGKTKLRLRKVKRAGVGRSSSIRESGDASGTGIAEGDGDDPDDDGPEPRFDRFIKQWNKNIGAMNDMLNNEGPVMFRSVESMEQLQERVIETTHRNVQRMNNGLELFGNALYSATVKRFVDIIRGDREG
eukprot:gene12534-15750_t